MRQIEQKHSNIAAIPTRKLGELFFFNTDLVCLKRFDIRQEHEIVGTNHEAEHKSNSPTLTPKPDKLTLEARIQAIEKKVWYLRAVVGQRCSTCLVQASHDSTTQHRQIIIQGSEALVTNDSQLAIDNLHTGLPLNHSDLQAGVTAGLKSGLSIIEPLQHNNAVDTGCPGFSSIAVDNLDNDFFNIDVNAAQRLGGLSAITQDWNASHMINNGHNNADFMNDMFDFAASSGETQVDGDSSGTAGTASQMTGNSGYNSFGEAQSVDDTVDFPTTSLSSAIGAAVGDNMAGMTQGDVRGSAMASNPINALSASSSTQGSRAPRRRLHRCVVSMNCHKTFARRADLDRHTLTHDHNSARTFSCPSAGCDRVGANGFWRPDKFKEHRAKMGH
ncbi:hypothetical protein DL98DRAFT_523020 [Cadophora sp. DSE1049]|nr:hypothetical protein DL98DRAFT_523020 [Cadophora sp. DSE1049]